MKKSLLRIALFSALVAFSSSLWANPSDSVNGGGPAGRIVHEGEVYRTFVPTDRIPGEGVDNIYVATNGVEGQLGVAGTAPGERDYHGGQWAVHLVTWNTEPVLLTSEEEVLTFAMAGELSIERVPAADVLCPVIPVARN